MQASRKPLVRTHSRYSFASGGGQSSVYWCGDKKGTRVFPWAALASKAQVGVKIGIGNYCLSPQ